MQAVAALSPPDAAEARRHSHAGVHRAHLGWAGCAYVFVFHTHVGGEQKMSTMLTKAWV